MCNLYVNVCKGKHMAIWGLTMTKMHSKNDDVCSKAISSNRKNYIMKIKIFNTLRVMIGNLLYIKMKINNNIFSLFITKCEKMRESCTYT